MSAIILQFPCMGDFPNRIRALRTAKGWSQQRLADAVGCSKMQISTLERGEQSVDVAWMKRLAGALEVEPGEILNPEDNPYATYSDDERRLLEIARHMDPALLPRFLAVGEAMAGLEVPDTSDEGKSVA